MEPSLPKPSQTTPAPKPAETAAWPFAGVQIGRIAALFSLIVAVFLIFNHYQGKAANPLKNQRMVELKAELTKKENSANTAAIKQEIRTLDLQLRQRYFQHASFQKYGVWLLIVGAIVALGTYKPATYRKKLPKPVKRSYEEYQAELRKTRFTVVVFGLAILGTILGVSYNSRTSLVAINASQTPTNTAATATATTAAPAFPSFSELRQNWPRFRGAGGSGISFYTNIPIAWDGVSGSNVVWKIELPMSSPSSPVLWKDHLFLIGATATNRDVFCFDTNGKLLWRKSVDPKRASAEPPAVMEDTGGYAPSTPATDGQRIFAIFANGDVAAFDFSGNLLWARNIGRPDNTYGHASSLETYKDRLLIQFDQAAADDKKSKILALDAATGQTAWESDPRPVPNSWATPILINNGQRDLLITCGNPFVIAHDPNNGKEVWRAKVLGGEVLPSPAYRDGVVYAAIEGEKLSAIPATGTGDVTTNVLWSAEDGLPDIVSPLCDGLRVYLVNSAGTLTCYSAKDGKKLWDKDLERVVKSSTSLVADHVYVIAEDGTAVVVQAADEYKEVARSTFGEEILSTPVFADGRMYVRGKTNLFCIGVK